jgi:hypothetical protein
MKTTFSAIKKRACLWGLLLFLVLMPVACTSGGGGDVDDDEPFSGGDGTGAEGISVFWRYFGEIGGGNAVTQTEDGGYVFAGEKGSDFDFSTKNLYLAKTDGQGVLSWSRTFGGDEGQTARHVAQCRDGGFIAVGYTDSGSSRNVFVARTDSTGNTLWTKSYDAEGGDDEGHAICVLTDGYAIAGSCIREEGFGHMGMDVWFFKIDDAGNKISGSDRFYDSPMPGWYRAYAMEQTRDGGFIMTGRAEPNAVSVIRISEDGAVQWSYAYGTGVGYAVRQAKSPDNGFIVAGSTTPFDSEESDVLIIKLDPAGNLQWGKAVGGPGRDVGKGIALTPDGGYLIAGVTTSFSYSEYDYMREDVYLISLAANGKIRWQKVKGQSPDNSESAAAIQATADGGYIVTGSSQAQVMLAKFDKNGETVELGELDFTFTVPESIGLINTANALKIADTVLSALTLPTRVGSINLDLFINSLEGFPPTAFCDESGSYFWNPAPAAPVSAGNSYRLVFSDCGSGDLESVLIGLLVLKIDAVSGDLTGNAYDVTVTLDEINITTTDDVGDTRISGALIFSRKLASGTYHERAAKAQSTLVVTEEGITETLSRFDISSTRSAGGTAYTIGARDQTLIVDPSYLTGSLTVTIQEPLAGPEAFSADQGKLFIAAQDGSTMIMTMTGEEVVLDIDTNGDGTTDATVRTRWDDLN